MKQTIIIPTELSEIKLSQFQKYLALIPENEDTLFLYQKMVQIFCDIDLATVSALKQADFQDIIKSLSQILGQQPPLKPRFTLDGVEYGFIPNLEDDLSSGEYMDLDTYITDWQEMHRAMAVLYRPIVSKQGNKYSIEPYRGSALYADRMKHMPLDVAIPASLFFWSLGNELLKSTLTYLEQPKVADTLQKAHNSENAGDGIHQYTALLKEMLDDSMKLQSYPFTNASPS